MSEYKQCLHVSIIPGKGQCVLPAGHAGKHVTVDGEELKKLSLEKPEGPVLDKA